MKDMVTEKLNVLVVDDQLINRSLIEKILVKMPVNIFLAESGDKAVKLTKDNDFAVILLDVQMPVIDGYETAKLIKKSKKSQHTPIIFITGLGTEIDNIKKGYEAGAVDYLIKPVTPFILRSKIEIFLNLHMQKKLIHDQKEQLAQKNKDLKAKLDEIKALKGLIPICSWCKKVRNDSGYWEKVEQYMGRISTAEFTHGICPDCTRKLKEDFQKEKNKI